MHTKTVDVSPEDLQDLSQKERSLQHWSVKLAGVTLEKRGIESTIHGIYEGRAMKLRKIAAEAGIDPEQITDLKVQGNQMLILLEGDPTAPEAPEPATPEAG